MSRLPKEIFVQIDDVDDDDVYLTAHISKDTIEFVESDRHPIGFYRLVEK